MLTDQRTFEEQRDQHDFRIDSGTRELKPTPTPQGTFAQIGLPVEGRHSIPQAWSSEPKNES